MKSSRCFSMRFHTFTAQGTEIDGGNFFDKYCMGSGPEDGMMNAGYAIWREAVADIMADSIISEYATIALSSVKGIVKRVLWRTLSVQPGLKESNVLDHRVHHDLKRGSFNKGIGMWPTEPSKEVSV